MADSVESLIAKALYAHVAAFDTELDIAWPNVAFKPTDDAYLRVDNLRNATGRPFIANTPARHQGILQVTVLSPLDAGEIASLEIAGALADHFQPGTRLAFTGGTVRIDKRADVTTLRDSEGARWMAPVSIQWWAVA